MAFLDIYLPEAVPGYPCASIPRTKTAINVTAGGKENRNQEWEHPLHRYVLPEAPGRNWAVVESLKKHWLITAGPAKSFAFRDPLDKASCDLLAANEPDGAVLARIDDGDQVIGTGNAVKNSFQLVKTYTVGGQSYVRTIHLPVLSSVVVSIAGSPVDPADYTVSRPGGVVTFNAPVPNGQIVRAGFLFDVEVRFEDDDVLEQIVRTYQVGGFAGLELIEVRPC